MLFTSFKYHWPWIVEVLCQTVQFIWEKRRNCLVVTRKYTPTFVSRVHTNVCFQGPHQCLFPGSTPTFVSRVHTNVCYKIQCQNFPVSVLLNKARSESWGCRNIFHQNTYLVAHPPSSPEYHIRWCIIDYKLNRIAIFVVTNDEFMFEFLFFLSLAWISRSCASFPSYYSSRRWEDQDLLWKSIWSSSTMGKRDDTWTW